MKNQKQAFILFILICITMIGIQAGQAQIGAWDPEEKENCEKTIESFKDKNQKFESYFNKAYGYAVFPTIGKGAIGIGGAHGKGLVYEQGVIVGGTKMTQITIGFQWGGQAYSEVIFFENKKALQAFKYGDIEFSGQASAVALTAGASADVAYKNGVAVFTLAKGGLMYEASIGGQKFKYFPAEDN